MIGKFIYDENKQRLNIEDALTITKGRWADGNELNEDRVGYFVTSDNENNEIEIATAASYICGVTIKDDTFLHPDEDDPSYCVVQSLGLCVIRDDGSLSPGDKCMPNDEGIAVRSRNNLGYRVVSRVDDNLIKIIVAPNNDMVSRIKADLSDYAHATLASGETEITITDERITATSIIEPFFEVGVGVESKPMSYDTITTNIGSVTMTFEGYDFDVEIYIRIL